MIDRFVLLNSGTVVSAYKPSRRQQHDTNAVRAA